MVNQPESALTGDGDSIKDFKIMEANANVPDNTKAKKEAGENMSMDVTNSVEFWEKLKQYKKEGHEGIESLIDNGEHYVEEYVEFWNMIELSKKVGHNQLREFLDAGSLFIGDTIPNKEFWDKVKKTKDQEQDANTTYLHMEDMDEVKELLKKEDMEYETVLRVILDYVFNGYELVKHILDGVVEKLDDDECSKCVDSQCCSDENNKAKIKIRLNLMFKLSQTDNEKAELDEKIKLLLRDLMDIQRNGLDRDINTLGTDKEISKLFQHPVFEILILKKWEQHKLYYIHHLRLFTLFVCLFTFFTRLSILKESKTRCDLNSTSDCGDWIATKDGTNFQKWLANISGILTDDGNKSLTNTAIVFRNRPENLVIYAAVMVFLIFYQLVGFVVRYMIYSYKKNSLFKKRKAQAIILSLTNVFYIFAANFVCFNPISDDNKALYCVLLPSCIALLMRELVQLKWNRKKYIREPESYLMLICLLSVLLALFSDTWAKQDDLKSFGFFRGVVAMGIFSAWTLIFIKLGNVSQYELGNFIKMFYNIIKTKLFAYMQVCFLLMIAFTLAFWILLNDHTKEDWVFSNGFWYNIVFTVTMSTGEFNTKNFYDGINTSQTIIKVFAMIFLIVLVIFSTITMINLLVAAIIEDHGKMKEMVEMDNLFSIANYVVETEKMDDEPVMIWYVVYNKFVRKLYKHIINDLEDKPKAVLEYCPRTICICNMDPLPIDRPAGSPSMEAAEREPLLLRLLQLRGENDKPCSYHQEKDDSKILIDLLQKALDRS